MEYSLSIYDIGKVPGSLVRKCHLSIQLGVKDKLMSVKPVLADINDIISTVMELFYISIIHIINETGKSSALEKTEFMVCLTNIYLYGY